MIDADRVIDGLEICLNGCGNCEGCRFRIKEPCKPMRCTWDEEQTFRNAIALLRKQKDNRDQEFRRAMFNRCYALTSGDLGTCTVCKYLSECFRERTL